MSSSIAAISARLFEVSSERRARRADPRLGSAVDALRRFQCDRFRWVYADLISAPETAPAALFFLEEIYAVNDFSERDAQFERIVGAVARIFPSEVISTLDKLTELYALSERLDTAMAHRLKCERRVAASAYCEAWKAVCESHDRIRQISLTVQVGISVSTYIRDRRVTHVLRAMRVPARLAGLGKLHEFLQRGFDSFSRLPDPAAFLREIEARELDFESVARAGEIHSRHFGFLDTPNAFHLNP